MTLDEGLILHKCGLHGCKPGPYCSAIDNKRKLGAQCRKSAFESWEHMIANSVATANSEGYKKGVGVLTTADCRPAKYRPAAAICIAREAYIYITRQPFALAANQHTASMSSGFGTFIYPRLQATSNICCSRSLWL